jgi:hypothetical protein
MHRNGYKPSGNRDTPTPLSTDLSTRFIQFVPALDLCSKGTGYFFMEDTVDTDVTLDRIAVHRQTLLIELRQRQAVVRDYVRGVARRYSTGLYLFGSPGTAKTHTVRSVLDNEIHEVYTYTRGHVTPLGLFELLADHRDEVNVLDDLARILKSDTGLQVLLAALEHPTSPDNGRRIEYHRQGRSESFLFRGGVIFISNLELHDDHLLNAFRSRVHVMNYSPTDAELGALMLDIASRGWPAGSNVQKIKPEEGQRVAEHVISEILRLGCPFDLRLLVNKAFPDYVQWKDGEAETNWHDLVTASIEEHLAKAAPKEDERLSREDQKEQERVIVKDILKTYTTRDDRVRAWTQRTGKSERAFYRRLAEIDTVQKVSICQGVRS